MEVEEKEIKMFNALHKAMNKYLLNQVNKRIWKGI